MIRIVLSDAAIDFAGEVRRLRDLAGDQVGALASFLGCVRGGDVTSLELQHHPRMTEDSIEKMVRQALARWPLAGVTVVHRIGELKPGEEIVLVLTASVHRREALEACDFLMDYLKTEAVFWKRERRGDAVEWVQSTEQDYAQKGRWDE